MVEELHGTEAWEDALAENGWTDALITGDEFGDLHEGARTSGSTIR